MRKIFILLLVTGTFLSAAEYQEYSSWKKIKDTSSLYQAETGEGRIDMDYRYIYSDDDTGGHSLSFQAFLPWHTRAFSFSYQNILGDDSTGLHEASLTLSHQLSSTLNVFTGLTGELYSDDGIEWGFSGNTGFLKSAGEGFFLSDRKIGISLEGLGTSVHGDEGWFQGINPLFNPVLIFNGSFFENENSSLTWMNTLSFPYYESVSWDTALNFDTSDGLGIGLASTVDSKLLSEGDFMSLTPRFQIRYTPGSSDRRWAVRSTIAAVDTNYLMSAGASWRPFYPDREGPETELDWQGVQYLSPDNDGLNDTLHIPLEVTDRNYIQQIRFTVFSEQEQTVYNRSWSRNDSLESTGDYIGRFFSLDETLSLPRFFDWDGLSPEGEILPDGWYYLEIQLEDIYGNITLSEHQPLNIDTLAPELLMKDPGEMDLIFSPNNDGNKDVLSWPQDGSVENLWEATILNSENHAVKRLSWIDSAPGDLIWDGRNQQGQIVPDGLYSYEIKSTDEAGNTIYRKVEGITVDTGKPDIDLTLNARFFSPDNDGINDFLVFSLNVASPLRALSWAVNIVDSENRKVRSFSGFSDAVNTLPEEIIFDGRKENGAVLDEGAYSAEFTVSYDNGFTSRTGYKGFELDITDPRAELISDVKVFSPDGDGNKDVLTIQVSSDENLEWALKIQNERGEVRRSIPWKGLSDTRVRWDGTDENGRKLPAGRYLLKSQTRDAAGNRGFSNALSVVLDDTEVHASISADYAFISPDGNGIHDSMVLRPVVERNDSIESFTLTLRDTVNREAVWSRSGSGTVPASFTWYALDSGGKALSDGYYSAELRIRYIKGNVILAVSEPIQVDTVAPRAALAFTDETGSLFSPDGDNIKDNLEVMQTLSDESEWKGSVLDRNLKTVAEFRWFNEAPALFIWDGRNKQGIVLPDDYYYYRVSATDRAGNQGQSELLGFTIDRNKPEMELRLSRLSFSPDGDGHSDTVTVFPRISRWKGIVSQKLTVFSSQGHPVWTDTIAGKDNYLWDGKSAEGALQEEGAYYAALNLEYQSGMRAETVSSVFYLDITAPRATVKTVGKPVFSPDGDGLRDTLTFLHETSPEEKWTGRFYGPEKSLVKTLSWSDSTRYELSWDGKDENGIPVPDGDYLYMVSATDKAGNSSSVLPFEFSIDTRDTPVSIRAEYPVFSPNSDGIQDTLSLYADLNQPQGIKKSSVIIRTEDRVTGDAGTVVKSFEYSSEPDDRLVWDGTLLDGSPAPDGLYRAEAVIEYFKGDISQTLLSGLVLDTEKPAGTVNVKQSVFSPDNDGYLDRADISFGTEEDTRWDLRISDGSGKTVFSMNPEAGQKGAFSWNGRNDRGDSLPDGMYTISLKGTDRGGNVSDISRAQIKMLSVRPVMSLETDINALSFHLSSINRQVTFSARTDKPELLESFSLIIRDRHGNNIYEENGQKLPADIVWSGKNRNGKNVPDGLYKAELKGVYNHGPRVNSGILVLSVDSAAPVISVDQSETLISPDGDGRKDSVTFMQSSIGGNAYTGDILDRNDRVVWSRSWSSLPGEVSWSGLGIGGAPVSDGSYRYRLTAVDKAGNRSSVYSRRIEVDTRQTPVFLKEESSGFSSRNNTMGFRVRIPVQEGISSWQFFIEAEDEEIIYSEKGRGVPSEYLKWNGSDNQGTAADGLYRAGMKLEYSKGNTPEVYSGSFQLDNTAPVINCRIIPENFTPDGNGVLDNLLVDIDAKDDSELSLWKMEVSDPHNNLFITFSGEALPLSRIQWDGRSSSGEVLQSLTGYPYILTVEDIWGNESSVRGTISTGLLVFEDSERLMISLPHFVFDSSGKLDKDSAVNWEILDKAEEILKEYDRHELIVESHSSRYFWNNSQKASIEEKEELLPRTELQANTIREELIKHGFNSGRIKASGLGGTVPFVPHEKRDEKWKNNRIVFYVKKN